MTFLLRLIFSAVGFTFLGTTAQSSDCSSYWADNDITNHQLNKDPSSGQAALNPHHWDNNRKVRVFVGDAGHPISREFYRAIRELAVVADMPIEASLEPKASDIMFVLFHAYKEPSRDFTRALEAYEKDDKARADYVQSLRSPGSSIRRKRKFSQKDGLIFSELKSLGIVILASPLEKGKAYNLNVARMSAFVSLVKLAELEAMRQCPEYSGIFNGSSHRNFHRHDLEFLKLLRRRLQTE